MSEATAIVNAHLITAIPADINEPQPLPPAMLLPQTTCRLDTLLGSFTSQDLWPKEMEKGLTSCRPVLDQREMWAYRQSANQDKMDPGDMELNSQRGPVEGRAGPLTNWPQAKVVDATKSNDRRVKKATVLVYKDGQMKTFKKPISIVVLLVYLFYLVTHKNLIQHEQKLLIKL